VKSETVLDPSILDKGYSTYTRKREIEVMSIYTSILWEELNATHLSNVTSIATGDTYYLTV
jgi:hypothetical protein